MTEENLEDLNLSLDSEMNCSIQSEQNEMNLSFEAIQPAAGPRTVDGDMKGIHVELSNTNSI